jgi:hypothetical protein
VGRSLTGVLLELLLAPGDHHDERSLVKLYGWGIGNSAWLDLGPARRRLLFRQLAIDAPRIGAEELVGLVLSAVGLQRITPDEMVEVLTAAPDLPVDRIQAQLHHLLENAMDESANKSATGASTEDLDTAHATEQYFVSLSQAVDRMRGSSADPL